jgi:hypothetical protein
MSEGKGPIMPDVTDLKLVSREDGQAVVRTAYNGKVAELRLDRLVAVRNGPSFDELVRQEIHWIVNALEQWISDPEHQLQ